MRVRKAVWLLAGMGAVMSLLACSNDDSESPEAGGGDYGLIAAKHPECRQLGNAVARYLDTGQPTDYDPDYGEQRQEVLSLTGEHRALAIRRYAGQAIQACDQAAGEDEAQMGGGRYHTNEVFSTRPHVAVQTVYQGVAEGDADRVCVRFGTDRGVQQQFARDLGYNDCREAVRELEKEVTHVTDYARSIYPRYYDPNTTTVRVDSCDFEISGGPALGAFVVSKIERGQWLVTGHERGPASYPA